MWEVLLLEDDAALGRGVRLALQSEKLHVTRCGTLVQAREAWGRGAFDLLILDVNLPDGSGLEWLRELRRESAVPVILLTANDMETDIVAGLETGADDYITKPFNPAEVVARVRSQLRRYTNLGGMVKQESRFVIGSIELDDAEKTVTVDGEPVSLTPLEYNILRLLMENPGRVFSSAEIYEKVWKDVALGNESTVAVHIRHLREKIEIDPANPRYLKVVWGQGYKMEKDKGVARL